MYRTLLQSILVALVLTSGASAQTSIAGKQITGDELKQVQTKCNELQTGDAGANADAPAAPAKDAPAPTAQTKPTPDSDAQAQSKGEALDIGAITIEDCRKAGLVQ